jgi:hypothetical protein
MCIGQMLALPTLAGIQSQWHIRRFVAFPPNPAHADNASRKNIVAKCHRNYSLTGIEL